MADIFELRNALRAANTQLHAAQLRLQELQTELDNINPGEVPPGVILALRARVVAQRRVVADLTTRRNAAQAAYQAAVMADPMHNADAGLPLVLLPVRIETAYLPGANGTDLVVRIYPDDIHVDAHEPELTDRELSSGTTYWKSVWGAGSNTARLDAAWKQLRGQLKPLRAAWVVHALKPSVPRPAEETPTDQPQPDPPLPTVATRPGTFTRAAHTTLLPDHWNVIGLRDGAPVFNVDGGPIPDTLDLSFGPSGTGANTSDLPFDEGARWLVDLQAAVAAGMAVRIPLAGPDCSLDQLFVLGVSARIEPAIAASRLEEALVAHQYTNGLGFLRPGTPTNNTSATRSAWQSAPELPSPTEIDTLVSEYQPSSRQNAALVARALGIDGSEALSVAPHGLDDQQSAVLVLQQQLWPALGAKALSLLYYQWDVPPGRAVRDGGWHLHSNPVSDQALADHAIGWVRSRGPLPVLRVGNQPYGLLPTSSLADWVTAPDDPTNQFVAGLRQFRPYWIAGVAAAPRVLVGTDPNPDATIVNVLSRLPVSNGLMVRADGDPVAQAVADKPFPVAPIPGLPASSELFLAAPSDTAKPMPVPIVGDALADQSLLLKFRDLFSDSIDVLDQTKTEQEWLAKYQSILGKSTFPGAPPPDLFTTLVADSFTNPLATSSQNLTDQVATGIVWGALGFDQNKNDPAFQQRVQQFLPIARAFLAQFDSVCKLDPGAYEAVLRELLDSLSHRYDAWVTSLASRRLDELRSSKPTGVVIGAYGWVEDLSPRTDLTAMTPPPTGFDSAFTSLRQRYIHAPSMHHAATAAVLRAGYDSHPHPDALAVNLVSRRVRVADWLAAGVRNGQTLGALLGYRFERGLHDAGLDALIEGLRKDHPLPLPTGPDGDVNGPSAREAIAARNVVDGLDLYRKRDAVRAQFPTQPQVGVLLDDLTDAVDALGDLLLAEGVHHLIGGNPLRAGLAVDTIGRGDSIPDRFDVVRTPRSGRGLTWQVGALWPADGQSTASGWRDDHPRALLAPHVNAWAASLLGNADRWQIACTITSAAGDSSSVRIGLDEVNLAPLDVVVEAAGEPSQLERRIRDALAAGRPGSDSVAVLRTPSPDGSPGFAELLALAARIRTLLSTVEPLTPQHVEGPDASPVLGLDIAELNNRVGALQVSFSSAVSQLAAAAQTLSAAVGASDAVLRTAVGSAWSALAALADHGIVPAYPVEVPNDISAAADALSQQARAVLAAVQPISSTMPPPVPSSGAAPADVSRWLDAVNRYVQNITGKAVPIVATFLLPPSSSYAASFALNAVPVGADEPAVMAWLRRTARVRPGVALLHDVLLATEVLDLTPSALTVAQLPVEVGAKWVALPFGDSAPPKARLATIVCTPFPIDPTTAFCGLVFDKWTEHLPGLTTVADPARGYESAEVTGVAFTVDAPDAYPPQALLLAIAPDPATGWSLDVLLDVVQETLELAKIRSVDLGDLPRLGRVLPAIHSGSNVDGMLNAAGVTP